MSLMGPPFLRPCAQWGVLTDEGVGSTTHPHEAFMQQVRARDKIRQKELLGNKLRNVEI